MNESEVKEKPKRKAKIEEGGNFDPKCSACGAPIYSGHAVRCKCGEIMHQFCFDKHVLDHHRPEGQVITVSSETVYDQNGKVIGLSGKWEILQNS